MSNEDILKENKGKKFDVVLMNPPYAGGTHERFLLKVLNLGNTVITVQPDSYLLKGKRGNTKIKDILNDSFVELEYIDPNKYFDAGFQNRVGILVYDINKDKQIVIGGKSYDDIYNYTKFSNDELLTEFYNKIKHLLDNNMWSMIKGTPGSHYPNIIENKPDNKWWIVQAVLLRGHVAPQQKDGKADDFYTYITNNEKLLNRQFIGQYGDLIKQIDKRGKTKLQYYFVFDSEQECKNYINYIKTDFARGILYLFKKDMNINLSNLPKFNFSDNHFNQEISMIDDWLFKKYDIDNEIRNRIEETLPDYYGIRK